MEYQIFKLKMNLLRENLQAKKELTEQIENIEYQMSGVKGIRYDKEHSSFNPTIASEIRNDLSEKLSEYERKLEEVNKWLSLLETECYGWLNSFTPKNRKMAEMVFLKGMTFYQVGKKMGYSDNAVWHRIKKEVENL